MKNLTNTLTELIVHINHHIHLVCQAGLHHLFPVSYTHLTLPTNREV